MSFLKTMMNRVMGEARSAFPGACGTRDSGSAPQQSRDAQDFAQKAQQNIPGTVIMFSGCHDSQTSADVGNTASFQLPADAGPGGAGGACTNALMKTVTDHNDEDLTWVELLDGMRDVLKAKGYEQIPQLSSSRELNVEGERFSVVNPSADATSTKKALLIGINYIGQQGELHGCHNDVLTMKSFLERKGFTESEMRIIMDDGQHEEPTAAGIVQGFQWLIEGAKANDSLFLHYSGHGGFVEDTSGDEEDGKDETLVPVDYQSAGQIPDDLIFTSLVVPVPEGCQLTCVMDCCHSGTVLDLPYMIKASEHLQGTGASMMMNPNFNWKKILMVGKKLYQMHSRGMGTGAIATVAMKELLPLLRK